MNNDATAYVLGFLFSPDYERVLLIRKAKPAWQCGRLNGIGGKIEAGEGQRQAMLREWVEETNGVQVQAWREFACLHGDSFLVTCFAAVGPVADVKSRESEQVEVVPTREIHALRDDMIENVPWLVALAIDFLQDERPIAAVIGYP